MAQGSRSVPCAAGANHSLVARPGSAAYSMGEMAAHSRGTPGQTLWVPTRIVALKKTVVAVSAGERHSLDLTERVPKTAIGQAKSDIYTERLDVRNRLPATLLGPTGSGKQIATRQQGGLDFTAKLALAHAAPKSRASGGHCSGSEPATSRKAVYDAGS